MTLTRASILRADARMLPLADDTVDLVVTSPPYFALRSYQDGGEHYAGQIGDEASPIEFVDALLDVTQECVRVLKPSGSLWINLGDKYAQSTERSRNGNGNRLAIDGFTGGKPLRGRTVTLGRKENGAPRKSLIGIPWRYALRCIDDLGLILRAEVIWSKPNGLPESVTDRVRRSHEQWFHFVQQPRYFSAVDEIREQYADSTTAAYRSRGAAKTQTGRYAGYATGGRLRGDGDLVDWQGNPLGKLPGSVWEIPTEPLKVHAHLGVDHFAAFPIEWPRRIIQGWSPAGVCIACGEGRRPVIERTGRNPAKPLHLRTLTGREDPGNAAKRDNACGSPLTTITGYTCACPEPTAPTTPAVVLDPFGGTGTTALVARALGRHGISIDMSADYCSLAQWRTTDEGELARAMRVPKPAKQVDGQASLLDLLEGA